MASHFSAGMVWSGPPNQPTPALLIRISRRPNVFCTLSASATTEFQSATSQAMASLCPPAERICPAVCCSRASVRPQTIVVAPRLASLVAIAAPIPRPLPVTRVTFPFNVLVIISCCPYLVRVSSKRFFLNPWFRRNVLLAAVSNLRRDRRFLLCVLG